MIDINDYMLLSQVERQKHLDLTKPCIDRGKPEKTSISPYCKGLLAHILDTTIPIGHKIYCCHACNNDRCCNPNHLYWGTASENNKDTLANGGLNFYQKKVAKYGMAQVKEMSSKVAKIRWNKVKLNKASKA